ncbi:hypothetical protein [Sphingomonas sp.]|uniref:hypothetical protein n=1 Tax=Sphingomonas sp. TaxID=28214 RepID=UPI0035C86767
MRDMIIPVLDTPAPTLADPAERAGAASTLALHREVLETMRLTIASSAHPSCACCHELAAALDRYLIA